MLVFAKTFVSHIDNVYGLALKLIRLVVLELDHCKSFSRIRGIGVSLASSTLAFMSIILSSRPITGGSLSSFH